MGKIGKSLLVDLLVSSSPLLRTSISDSIFKNNFSHVVTEGVDYLYILINASFPANPFFALRIL